MKSALASCLRVVVAVLGFLLPALLPASVHAQGTVVFGNFAPAVGLHAPVYDTNGVAPVETLPMRFQLLAGATAEALRPVGEPLDLSGPGVFGPSIRTLPDLGPGQSAVLQVQAWTLVDGRDFAEAEAVDGRRAISNPVTVVLGGDTRNGTQPPSLPAYLLGLKPMIVAGNPAPPRILRLEWVRGVPVLQWLDRAGSYSVPEFSDVMPPRWEPMNGVLSTNTLFTFEDRGTLWPKPGKFRIYRLNRWY